MLPLLASLVPPTVGLPEGLLDDLPVVDRTVAPSRVPRSCDLARELHERLAIPSVDGDEISLVLSCDRSGAIDPLDVWPAWTEGRSALDAARDVDDLDLAGARLVDVYAFGQAMRYGSLVSELAGLALQLEALDTLDRIADDLSPCASRRIRHDLAVLGEAAPKLTLTAEAELLPSTVDAPRLLAPLTTWHARAACAELEPVLRTDSDGDILAAIDDALATEASRWIPDATTVGTLSLLRDAVPDAAAVRDRTARVVLDLTPTVELVSTGLLQICDDGAPVTVD